LERLSLQAGEESSEKEFPQMKEDDSPLNEKNPI
jgi:hypothetical protein